MKKEDYIKKQIERYESRKLGAQSLLDHLNGEIEKIKNLSDEEYEKILEFERREREEDEKIDEEVEKMLKKLGMTLEDLDNISLEDIDKMTL